MADAGSASWVTSLIQIGIPSAVAIVSLAFNFLTARAAHEKELKMSDRNAQNKAKEAAGERSAILINQIADAISAVENAIGRHSGVFRSYPNLDGVEELIGDDKNLSAAYSDLCAAIDACFGLRAKVSLLGDPNALAYFELFLEALFAYQRTANPAVDVDAFELSERYDTIKKHRGVLLQKMSPIYLYGHSLSVN